MKKYAFFALLVILLGVGGCRASDCGCPMSKNDQQMMHDKSGFPKEKAGPSIAFSTLHPF